MAQSTILGWKVDSADRAVLLARFPPRYARVIADHVTFGPAEEAPPMPEAQSALVIGRADDCSGVEALVVEVNGTIHRWDSSKYHITWSLEPGREAVESNQVIAQCGWEEVDDGALVGLSRSEWP